MHSDGHRDGPRTDGAALSATPDDRDGVHDADSARATSGAHDAADVELQPASVSPQPVHGVPVAVLSASGPASAGLAPEQDEHFLPPRRIDDRPLSRADRVGEALDRWAASVSGAHDGPSFLAQMRSGEHVLDLTHCHPSGHAQLLAGRGATRLSSLVREAGALADARAHARAIRETAQRQAEEVGLVTCHLAIGEATWLPLDGGAPLHAPVLVRPITLRLRGNAREDVELEIDATVDVNPVLLRALRDAGVAVDARALLAMTQGPYGFDPNPVLDAFRALGEPLPGFRVSHALVVGNLMDTAGPLVEDLTTDPADWVSQPLVAALAGDDEARAELAAAVPSHEEGIDPQQLVAAVEPDHEAALERVLDGGHVALTTPPGADPIALVLDLAEELNARGRSVLVVSQRRRSLARIVELAEERGLAELIFDLSPDPALQRNASEALLASLSRAGSYRPPLPLEEPQELAAARETLAGHVQAMHRIQEPWGVSAHQAISALAGLTRRRPAPRTSVRLAADVAARMVGADRETFAEALRDAARCGALSTTADDTSWFGATIATDTQAARALELVDEMRGTLLPQLRARSEEVSSRIGLAEARSLSDVHDRLDLLERVRRVLGTFHAAVFSAPLDQMIAASADKAWRAERGIELRWSERRRLHREAVALLRAPDATQSLHSELVAARRVRDAWASTTADGTLRSRPRLPERLDQATTVAARMQTACDELAVLLSGTPAGGDLVTADHEVLGARLDSLHADAASLEDLPQHTTILRRLDFDGLGPLVDDLRDREVPEEHVADELELAWWTSVLELIAGAEPTISRYDGASLSRVAEQFRRLDAEHLARAAHRVRSASDDVLVATMKRFPDTSRAAIAELSRASTTSVRDLAAKYEDILFRARPTWLASPFLVPQIVPRGRHFDVVIVADGGRLPTWAALPSIARARQTVVIGDPLEFPGDDEPTVLDDMLAVAPRFSLRRDEHPATGGLRSFALRRASEDEVLAVPTPTVAEPDRLVLVDGARGAVVPGVDVVESSEVELRRVTDLVIEHARTRPERSLAVVTFTPTHAMAVLDRVLQTVGVVPMLRDFFDPERPEAFTVVPVAHAAGIVRDDVIVSVGFGKTPHGRLIHRFGPLSGANGRKALVTALTRSRGRTTVVSGLRAEDIDVTRLRADGARDLVSLLTYLYTGEDPELTAPVIEDADAAGESAVAAASESAPSESDALPDASGDAKVPEVEDAPETGPADSGDAASEPSDGVPAADGETGATESQAAGAETDESDTETSEEGEPETGSDPGNDGDAEPDADVDLDADIAPDADTTPDATIEPDMSASAADALVADLADRLWRRGLIVDADYGLTEDRIELALGHPDLPGRYLVAVDTDGDRYVGTASQRERDRLRAERLERAGWTTERVWSWALFIDPEGETERIRDAVERAYAAALEEKEAATAPGAGASQHQLPRPQVAPGQPLSHYATEDFDAVVEYICSDGRSRLEDQLAAEVRAFLGFDQRSVLLDVSVASAIRRFQARR